MKTLLLVFCHLFLLYAVNYAQPGFSSEVLLSPIDLSLPTKDKPQAKVWNYANQWWCVLSVAEGTVIYRLEGTNWKKALMVTAKTSKPDCIVDGNLVHVLAYRGSLANTQVQTVEYDQLTNTYQLWKVRQDTSSITFGPGTETAAIAIDGRKRMWVASAVTNNLKVWWSDHPYNSWSAPITIATGLKPDDICAITAIPSQRLIGVFWSNQNAKRFGFKTHVDGTSPGIWSADELPASKFALDNVGLGLADDHINMKVARDGTLYCVAKTGYDKAAHPKVILLVRRPSGNWDNDLYPVTIYPEGTQPLLLLNEDQGKLKVVYSTSENGGNVVYRESATSKISFGPARTLFSEPGKQFNYATSTHQTFNSEIVIMATEVNSNPQKAVSLLAYDNHLLYQGPTLIPSIGPVMRSVLDSNKHGISMLAYPNPFKNSTNISFKLENSDNYTITVFDSNGSKLYQFIKGWAEGGVENKITFNGSSLASGPYLLCLKTSNRNTTIKLFEIK